MKTLEAVKSKIFNTQGLMMQLAVWKLLGDKIVFTNGCFDILHLGHVDYLCKAADEGDRLIIAVNTDRSVSSGKGLHRPINKEEQRSMILASLRFTDAVILFDEATPYELIKKIQPNVLVKGSDYKTEDVVGYDVVISKGGLVKTIDLLVGYSTTLIEEKIIKTKK